MNTYYLIAGVIIAAIAIVMACARWLILEKTGEKGWKGIVPVLSGYTLAKQTDSIGSFWGELGCAAGLICLAALSAAAPKSVDTLVWIYLIALTALVVLFAWKMAQAVAEAFGKDDAFAVGMTIVPAVYSVMLAKSSAAYIGIPAQTLAAADKKSGNNKPANTSTSAIVGRVIATVLLLFLSALVLIPLIWTICMSLKPEGEVFNGEFFPHVLEWGNYSKAVTSIDFFGFLFNTIKIVIPNVIGQVCSCAVVAYGFSRFNFKGKRVLFMILLATMMIPGQVLMIPQFLLYYYMGWVNTFLPLTVPAFFATSGYNIFLLRSFMSGIPKDFDEAATIDGAGPLRSFVQIMLPMCKPVLTAIGVFTFMGAWNDFNGPLIYLNDATKYTLAIGLSFFKGLYTSKWHLLMAASVLVMLPVLILFFLAQDFIIDGISVSSGTKG